MSKLWRNLKNGPYNYTLSEGNGRVFQNLAQERVKANPIDFHA